MRSWREEEEEEENTAGSLLPKKALVCFGTEQPHVGPLTRTWTLTI